MLDPKDSDDFVEFKVFIKEWFGSFPFIIQAKDSQEAACLAVESNLSDGETIDNPLLVVIEKGAIKHTFEIIENSQGELIVKRVT